MKACEEWWENKSEAHFKAMVKLNCVCDNEKGKGVCDHYFEPEKYRYEEGWREALEWVLSWETDSESIEIIEKELGDKSITPSPKPESTPPQDQEQSPTQQ